MVVELSGMRAFVVDDPYVQAPVMVLAKDITEATRLLQQADKGYADLVHSMHESSQHAWG
ncbi:MAG: hypothetical protein GX552_16670 [Chloroflexi bacterium]|jgi:hypothetical protein|nr:hypothetical protein [Chloroflexota bacterium]